MTGPEPCCMSAAHGQRCDCTKMDAVRLAYGLLWNMHIDRRHPNLRVASDARTQLSNALSRDDKKRGIEMARDRLKAMKVTPPIYRVEDLFAALEARLAQIDEAPE